jgi:hypothetical protein
MTSFIYKNCAVGEIAGISDLSFGFDILNELAQPILSLAFENKRRRRTGPRRDRQGCCEGS